MAHIVIIGNGVSGITAARYIRKKSDHEITVISAETEHYFSRTALMYVYMGHMKYENIKPYEDWFWKKNRINLVYDYVESIDFNAKTLHYQNGRSLKYDKLVLGVGSKPNKFDWPGQDLKGVQGLYGYPDLESMDTYTKDINRAVVVGGGLIGIEMAEMLRSRNIPVTFLVREDSFWNSVLPKEESAMVNGHIREHHVDLRLECELDEVLPDENGRVRAIKTKDGEQIDCEFVGLTAGVTPNIDFLKHSKLERDKGILINEYFETNIEDVYAIGDCAQHKNPPGERKKIEQVWYTGKIMGETLAHTLCGDKKAYNPGVWFNSAKFFDIEYQTYGWVWNEPKEGQKTFFWKHPHKNILIRINYNKKDKKVLGFNLFGIRFIHNICANWIDEGKTIEYVIEHLRKANFDPELYDKYEPLIKEKFEQETFAANNI